MRKEQEGRKYKTPLKTCENCKCLGSNYNYPEKKHKPFCSIYGDVFFSKCEKKIEKRG